MICERGHRRHKAKPCKYCHRENVAKNQRTPTGLVNHRWRCMTIRIGKKSWPDFDRTREQFVDWALNDPIFRVLYAHWKGCGFSKELSPSLDRRDSLQPYRIGNLQWLPWKENHMKGYTEDKEAKEAVAVEELSAEELDELVY